eukprot:scaffold20988_cov32-Prasinocladus_malaysianus.AAC.2
MQRKNSMGNKDKSWFWRLVAPQPKSNSSSSFSTPCSPATTGGFLSRMAEEEDQEDQQQQRKHGKFGKPKPPLAPQGGQDAVKTPPTKK